MNQHWAKLEGNRPLAAGALVVLVASYPALVVLALLARPWPFAVAAGLGYLAEAYAARYAGYALSLLSRASVGTSVRFTLRAGFALVLAARVGVLPGGALVTIGILLMALHAVRGVQTMTAQWITRRRRLPVATRNVDVSDLHIPDAPPVLLTKRNFRLLLYLDVLGVGGVTVASGTGIVAVGVAGAAAGLALGLAALVAILPDALRARRFRDRQRLLDVVNDRINAYAPEVLTYFSGSVDSAYQVNMWLSTLESLDRRVVLVLRERALLRLLDVTSLPVICIPSSIDFMNFRLPDVKVALYIANVGKNIHMLRVHGVRHVFIGHGDSDKTASFNPFSKVHDEIWVAGRAGRDRYLRAGVGVLDESIVEVGRPQLASITTMSERPRPDDHVFTVLYAPTWEGWDDPYQTSLTRMGEQIARVLLDRDPPVRLLYKPHPLSGTRQRSTAAAHDRIVALIDRANARSRARHGSSRGADDPARRHARESLPGLADRLAELSRSKSGGRADEAQTSRDSALPTEASPAEAAGLTAEWHTAYWESEPPWASRVVTGSLPTLYECFNEADLLITDVSSVVGDFMQSQKPYVVCNPADLEDEVFRERYPSTSAAYLLGSSVDELAVVVDQIRDAPAGRDSMAARRRELKTYLLGPDEPDAMTRFSNAVESAMKEETD